jgi:hypothetical protein
MPDEEYNLTFRNDTDSPLAFDWYTFAMVAAPIPEPVQSMMSASGGGMPSLFGLGAGTKRRSRINKEATGRTAPPGLTYIAFPNGLPKWFH